VRPAAAAWARVAAVTAGVVALDQATKALVRANLARGDSEAVFPGVEIVHTRNSGVAFGALSGGGAVVTVVIAVALVALVAYFATHIRRPLVWLPTGMLLGGAIGNVIDRLRFGQVVDFLDLHAAGWHWPAFNVADSAITIGAALLILDGFRHHERRADAPS
jgi:signal peptidase II